MNYDVYRVIKETKEKIHDYEVGVRCTDVGHPIVKHIEYHEPDGPGDAHYCTVTTSSTVTRLFVPDIVVLSSCEQPTTLLHDAEQFTEMEGKR